MHVYVVWGALRRDRLTCRMCNVTELLSESCLSREVAGGSISVVCLRDTLHPTLIQERPSTNR